MVVKEYKLKVDTGDAQKSVDGLTESIKEGDKGVADYSEGLGALDSATGGMVSKFKGLTKTIKGATKGFKSMKVALIGTGIGIFL